MGGYGTFMGYDGNMKTFQNSLMSQEAKIQTVNIQDLDGIPNIFISKTKSRNIKILIKKETAIKAVEDLTPHQDLFGFTMGQFSLIELLEAILEKTGPASITISTWTAANADLGDVLKFIKKGLVVEARFLLDFSFQRRQPAVAQSIRQNFGPDSVRVTRNHAKFFLVENEAWKLTCKTSMNLNTNPRFEDFDISNDAQLFNFLNGVVGAIFKKTNQKD